MIPINIAIDYSDLLKDGKEKDEVTASTMLEHVKSIIESSVLSALEGVQLATKDGPQTFIRGVTQRDADRILDAIENVGADGMLVMPDKRMVKLQKLWENRLVAPAGGATRKLHQRIDRIICPDAYKKDDDADGPPADAPSTEAKT